MDAVCLALLVEVSEQGEQSDTQCGDGNDRGIGEGGEAPLLDFQRFHNDDVVRLKVVVRRREYIGLTHINGDDFRAIIGLADDFHRFAFGEVGHVACHGNGLKQVDLRLVNLIHTRLVYLAQHSEVEVGQLHDERGLVHVFV